MHNVLVIRVGRVGDTVMMTSALKALLQCYPDAMFTVIASPEGKQLLKDYSDRIELILPWDRHGPLAFIKTRQLAARLKGHAFDKIFCFDTNPRIADLVKDVPGQLYWYQGSDQLKHCARHYLDLVASASGQPIDNIPVNLPVSKTSMDEVNAELEQYGINKDDILVMFHPTFSGYSRFFIRKRTAKKRKLWPAKFYSELGKRLASTKLANGKSPKVLIALLPAELSLGEKIVSLSDNKITLLRSDSGFQRYKALLHRADVLVTPDSGPMHVAASVDTRIVAFFSMKDPADCGPYFDPDRFNILRSEDTQQPENGIASIGVDTVFNACMDQINKALTEQTTGS